MQIIKTLALLVILGLVLTLPLHSQEITEVLLLKSKCTVKNADSITSIEAKCIENSIYAVMKNEDFSKYYASTRIWVFLVKQRTMVHTDYTVGEIANNLNNR